MPPTHEVAYFAHVELRTPGPGVGAEDDRVLPHARHSAGGAGAVTAGRDMLIEPRDRQGQES
jgi:hypothetical protein